MLSKSLNRLKFSLLFMEMVNFPLPSHQGVLTLANYRSRLALTLRQSYRLSCALKEFKLSSSIALAWPQLSGNLIDSRALPTLANYCSHLARDLL